MESLRAATLVGRGTTVGAKGAVSWPTLCSAFVLALAVVLAVVESFTAQQSPRVAAVSYRAVPHDGLASLPIAAQGVVSATLGANSRAYQVGGTGGGFEAQNPAQGLHLHFGSGGVQIASGKTHLGVSLRAVGYGASLRAVGAVTPTARANRVTYARAGFSEWYMNGPLGLEQGFTLSQAPSGHASGPLTFSLTLTGDARASLASSGQSFTLSRSGGPSLRYGGLMASDARGHALPSWLRLHAGRLLLHVDARGARYPLRIDPFIQQGSKLTGAGESGKGQFGSSVALSSDSNTALIGGEFDNGTGAAWVFTRSGGVWTQQGPKITPGARQFGSSVALSSDGNTALIGARTDGLGDAWVYTRSGGVWTQQAGLSAKTGEESENGEFGFSVALSSDGNTALIGGPRDEVFEPFPLGGIGAAWVFTRSGGVWTQQGSKLTGGGEIGEGQFGFSVALSSDGNTALIGGYSDNTYVGAAWSFTRSGGVWTQQGSKLTGGGESGKGQFGFSVALSSDGNTALIGGDGDNSTTGAAWAFTRAGGVWTQQGSKLTASGSGGLGFSAALSSDGNHALVGGQYDNNSVGAAWIFGRAGGVWAQQESKLTGGGESGKGAFGHRVALSSDGLTALIGGPADAESVGAAWVFVNPPPTVTKVSPPKGPVAGGTTVTISGTNFIGVTVVQFGAQSAASFKVNSVTSLTAVSPAEAAGTVDVTVTTSAATSTISSKDRFQFTPTVTNLSPNTGPQAGGTSVTISGTGFALGTTGTIFRFESTRATSVNCSATTTCTAIAPAHLPGKVDIKATVNKASSPKNPPADQFSYT